MTCLGLMVGGEGESCPLVELAGGCHRVERLHTARRSVIAAVQWDDFMVTARPKAHLALCIATSR